MSSHLLKITLYNFKLDLSGKKLYYALTHLMTIATTKLLQEWSFTLCNIMAPKILLVNPPIYDFAAYDFWLKPYGMLSVAGKLRGKADFKLFDYMDRLHPFASTPKPLDSDQWNRGQFYFQNGYYAPDLPHRSILKERNYFFVLRNDIYLSASHLFSYKNIITVLIL